MTQEFRALGVSERVSSALARRDVTAPFPIQSLVLRDAIAGRDVLAKSPTGTGKTLAFAIPLVERIDPQARGPVALVLVPTRELALQVAEETEQIARSRNLRVATAFGGVSIQRQAQLTARAHIVVATPGRLEDLMQRRLLRLDTVTLLVLDEADRMLDLGFRPAVDRIVGKLSRQRQTMFFSATLDGEVGRLAKEYTHDPIRVEAELPEQEVAAIEHRFVTVRNDEKLDLLVKLLGDKEEGRDLALVFVRTKRGASRLAERLEHRGVRVAALHGDMSQAQRNRSLDRFSKGHVDTLVATDVAARGLDVDAITHVINFDPPAEESSYVHRVGRTGRAGRSGIGITMVLDDQREMVSKMAATAGVEQAMCERTNTVLHVPLPPEAKRPHRKGQRGPGPQARWRSSRTS